MKKNTKLFLPFFLAMYGMIIIYLFGCSCSESYKKNIPSTEKSSKAKSLIIKKPGSTSNDTVIIKVKSAVFFCPDSAQMKKIKSVNENAIFDMLTHNCHYQIKNARTVIKRYWPQIKIIETSRFRYLLFEKANKNTVCIDLNDKNDICGLFLFDKKKDPVLADMPNIDTQLGFYFSR